MNYMDYKGKSVLLIGSNTFCEAVAALEHGAELVEVMPTRPGGQDDVGKLLSWPGRKDWASEGKVQVRNVTGVTLEDEGAWDDVVIAGVDQIDLPEVTRRAQTALRFGGKVMLHKDSVAWQDRLAPPTLPEIPEAQDAAERKIMLHVHNVRRCGGTGNFVYDMARCFPGFQHVALCVNDAAGDPVWIRDVSNIMRTMYSPVVTEDLLDEINPRVVVLHATVGARVDGEWPYSWLQAGGKRFVIRLHHIPTHPILPADLSVFVSEYVKSRYEQFLGKQIKRHIVMPPCTDLAPYAAIKAREIFPPVATPGGKACEEMQALMTGQLSHWTWDSTPPGRIGKFSSYLSRFPFAVVWSGHQETWCRTVTESLAAGCVTIAHRAGAIPEQIEHGVNGYLFDDGAELAKILDELQNNVTPGRLAQVAQAGREWAVQNAGFERMKADLYPFLTEALMEA